MKPISPRTLELVEALVPPRRLLDRWLGRGAAPPAGVLDEIVASGELEAALALAALAVAGPAPHREPALAAIDRLVRSATPDALVWLEQRARLVPPWRRQGRAWAHELTPDAARTFPAEPAAAAGIASLHGVGYVREAAVEVLSRSDDPIAVPFLLIRANDWVEPVRAAAVRGLEAQLSRGGAARFVPYLELVDRLKRAGRNDLRPLAEAILAALAAPDAAAALSAGCASGSRAIRRRCFDLAFSARTFDPRPLIPRGLADPDAVVRILTAKGAVRALAWVELEPFIEGMLSSTTPAARFSALEATWKRRGAESRAVQERFALDPHPHVRGTARWFLTTLPGFDARAFYRAALPAVSGERELVGAIEGLGEVGAQEDAAVLVPFVHHARARVRAGAVHALGAIGSGAQLEELVAALSDPSARVCRAARRVLLRGTPVDPERLTVAALRSRYPHERRAAVELAGGHDHWVAGILLLRIAGTTDPETAARARAALAGWEARYNRVFTRPTPRQIEEFASLLAAANLDDHLRVRLGALVPAMKARGGA